jgi:hypothetical protein
VSLRRKNIVGGLGCCHPTQAIFQAQNETQQKKDAAILPNPEGLGFLAVTR